MRLAGDVESACCGVQSNNIAYDCIVPIGM